MAKKFPVWKTITLGTCKTLDEYRAALKDADVHVDGYANDLLRKVVCSPVKTGLDLVRLSGVDDFGFESFASRADVYARAIELGLELCPAEVGPALCIQYPDQRRDGVALIGMQVITGPGGVCDIFRVVHLMDGLWLKAYRGHPEEVWQACFHFVFVQPRS